MNEQTNVSPLPLLERGRAEGERQTAEFGVDSNACLGIGKGDQRIRLEPAEVVQLLDFLTAITYKTLAQRAGNPTNTEGSAA